MFCSHCGKEINPAKVEKQTKTHELVETTGEEPKVSYICPRCGHLVHDNLDKEEVKALARASHSEMQRGSNAFAFGMGFIMVGLILLTIGILFFQLSYKAEDGTAILASSAEFIVFATLTAISTVLLVSGIASVVIGVLKKAKYNRLLEDINNETFVQ